LSEGDCLHSLALRDSHQYSVPIGLESLTLALNKLTMQQARSRDLVTPRENAACWNGFRSSFMPKEQLEVGLQAVTRGGKGFPAITVVERLLACSTSGRSSKNYGRLRKTKNRETSERTRGLFGRSVRSCNVNVYLSGTPTASWNAASSLGGNFAVQYDTCTPLWPSLSSRDMPYLLGG
jgi:hypothetical protein